MKESEAAKIVTMLATAWPDAWRFLPEDQQDETRALWRSMLLDIDYRIGDATLRRLIGTLKRMPSIAEFRATCSAYTEGRREHGGEAWGTIKKLIGRYGVNRTPKPRPHAGAFDHDLAIDADSFYVDDPVIFRVIDAMGWRELCLSENATADRARVIELYEKLGQEAAIERSVRAIAPPIPERRNGGNALGVGDIVANMLPGASK